MKSQTFKIITGVIGILGVIGSFVGGFIFKAVELDSSFGIKEKFNFQFVIAGLFSTIIVCLVLYGIACILGHVEDIKIKLDKKDKTKGENLNERNLNTWECPKCHTLNIYSNENKCNYCDYKP